MIDLTGKTLWVCDAESCTEGALTPHGELAEDWSETRVSRFTVVLCPTHTKACDRDGQIVVDVRSPKRRAEVYAEVLRKLTGRAAAVDIKGAK